MTTRCARGDVRSAGVSGLRAVVSGLLALYAVLLPLHLLLLSGVERVVMACLAGSTLLALAAALLLQRRRRPGPSLLVAVMGLPAVNSLAHLGVTGELHQTTTAMLVLVGLGAVVPTRRTAWAMVLTLDAGWWAVVTLLPMDAPALRGHYLVQMAMATFAAAVLLELRMRRDTELATRITDLEDARTSLTASEVRFRSIFADSPVGIGLADEDGHLVSVNDALCRLLDRTPADLLGRSTLSLTHPDDQADHARASSALEGTVGGVARLEKRYLRPSGEVRWAWLSLTRVDGPAGEPWTLAHVQDVTDRHATEQALSDSEANLAAVARVVRSIRAGADARTSLTRAACELGDAASAHLIEPLDDGRLVVSTSTDARMVGTEIDLAGTSATAHVWRTGEPLHIPDPLQHPLCDPRLVRLAGAQTLLWEPVVIHGTTVALLAVAWAEVRPEADDRSARLVALLADEAAVAIEHDSLLARYAQLATTDELTGLPNRRAWDSRLATLTSAAARAGTDLVVAVADVDHFKAYNDRHGHPGGDALLQSLAGAWGATVREVDLLARWGGEEFALALPGCDDPAAVLERLRAAMPAGATVSIGWTVWRPGEPVADAVGRADAALFDAKHRGRDRVVAAAPVPAPRGPRAGDRSPRPAGR